MSQMRQRSKLTLRGCLGYGIWLFAAGLVFYVAVCIYFAVWQRSYIYFPTVSTSKQVDDLARSAKLERWKDASGRSIGMKRLCTRQPAEGRVLVVYGNGSSATGCAHYADVIQDVAAFDVFILEYPGYADRPGTPGQNSLFRAADEAFGQLPTNGPTCLVGESLGSGVAAFLAGKHADQVAGVALLGAYNCLTDVGQYQMPWLPVHLLLLDRFRSEDYLRHYHGPVAVLVAAEDEVVPEKLGRRLYDQYAGPKQLWKFEPGTHATVMDRPAKVWAQVIAFWQAEHIAATPK